MSSRGNRTNHVADIQEALNDWQQLADLAERYEEADEDGNRPLDQIRLQIAHRIFDHGTAEDIYECMRSAKKYGAKCSCKEPNLEDVRVEATCGECYGRLEVDSVDTSVVEDDEADS